MYCSISCSRAWRSPSSWYRRSRTLSFSATDASTFFVSRTHVTVDDDVVDRRLEHAAQAELASSISLEPFEHAGRQRAD